MGIMQREWTEDDEAQLNLARENVAKLESKKAMIERVRRKAFEDKWPSVYKTSGPSKLRSTF
ncbi:hypothetical protein pA_gene0026 [Vibrio phage 13VT501A]|nr:hypothetical protein pA_gene0026 [Vibrio phage 13VT501A]